MEIRNFRRFTNNNDYNAAIDILGDTVIQNCYISGCSAPVLALANATITNTTLYGGAVAVARTLSNAIDRKKAEGSAENTQDPA